MNNIGISKILRYNEYYKMQNILDDLYEKSARNYKFTNLMDLITSDKNIEMAYRRIKRNHGSTTVGCNNKNIEFFENMKNKDYKSFVKNQLKDYKPGKVKRVMIPKTNGTKRPLGIPNIEDRLIQQCILQILDPICEAKFYYRSFGFRQNRSTKHAVGACMNLINFSKMYYCVDIDIKGFFDNVNHGKLLKQIWNLGIRDKNLISIISKILKSEIENEGIPEKGVPQGGILSPLLSNIVLNELDWWIANQWESFPTDYKCTRKNGRDDNTYKYRQLRNHSNLKEIYIVRYADDFKIFCKDYRTAQKIFVATTKWLKERLKLDISTEKSKITNLKKNYTTFLGVDMKAFLNTKTQKYTCKSKPSKKAYYNIINGLKRRIKDMQFGKINTNEINKLNSHILGIQNYYKMSSKVAEYFGKINWILSRFIEKHIGDKIQINKFKSNAYKRIYKNYNGKYYSFGETTIFCIYGVTHSPPIGLKRKICSYTKEGRDLIHKELASQNSVILSEYLMKNPNISDTQELRDNKITKVISQNGKCYVTKKGLIPGEMECHHKIPRSHGGTDKFENLVWLDKNMHKLIHIKNESLIEKYIEKYILSKQMIKNLNYLRKLVGNNEIKYI